ncbi:MAG: type 1 glutamine amidotransferase domain-containing protein [Actinomycetota bacterium]
MAERSSEPTGRSTLNELRGMRVAFVVANVGIEDSELAQPWEAVKAAGGSPQLVAPEPGQAQVVSHRSPTRKVSVDLTTDRLDVQDFDAVVIPGGVANPDRLRLDRPAVDFVRGMVEAGKPLAVICHGPWMLVEADVVRGRRLTSWPSLRTDIRNAGGRSVDEQVVVCTDGPNTLITSRKPDDLPAFCRALTQVFADFAESHSIRV